MPDFEGPWSRPPAAPPSPGPAPRRGVPLGLVIWLALLVTVMAAVGVMSQLNPTALTKADTPGVWYMFGLLALVSSGLVRLRRFNAGAAARGLALWVGLFALIFLGYAFRGDLAAAGRRALSALNPEHPAADAPGQVVIGRGESGGFYVVGQVNGAPARFLVDTGATDIVLSSEDAARAGIAPAPGAFNRPAETANGVGYGAAGVAKTLTIGAIRMSDVPVEINHTPMSASLLGMTFLKRLDSYEFKGDQLTLRGK